MKKKITIIIIFISIVSCEKIVNINITPQESKLVLNCFFSSEKKIKVHLSKNVSIFDTTIAEINNAEILILENGILFDSLINEERGFYSSKRTPQSNTCYTIKAKYANYSNITATDTLPQQISLTNAEQILNAGCDEEGKIYDQIKFTFNDPENIDNYYEVAIYSVFTFYEEEIKSSNYIFSENPVLINEGDMEFYPHFLVFSDELLQSYCEIKLNYFRPSISENYKIIFYFRSISKPYYLYKKRIIRHINNQVSDIWGGTGEPIQMYTNITSGLGIFAGYELQTDTFPK